MTGMASRRQPRVGTILVAWRRKLLRHVTDHQSEKTTDRGNWGCRRALSVCASTPGWEPISKRRMYLSGVVPPGLRVGDQAETLCTRRALCT